MITQDYLKSRLNYNPETGVFVWKRVAENNRFDKTWNTRFAGLEAGCLRSSGGVNYMKIYIDGTPYQSHRLAWIYSYGEEPKCIDHINGNPLDNRLLNLRNVTQKTNARNQKMNKTNSSGFAGVSWCKNKKKWMAQIKVNQKTKFLGYFANISDAVKARVDAEVYFDFHPNHGLDRKDLKPATLAELKLE